MYAYAQSKVEICGVNTAKLQTLKNDEMRELLLHKQNVDRMLGKDERSEEKKKEHDRQ